jgi:tRNA(Ile)-lysidine synthase
MHPLLKKFLKYNEQHKFFSTKKRILVAVSGGVDSMVLCRLMKLAQFPFSVAHANFQLRGNESDEDEKFVVDFCFHQKVECFTQKFSVTDYVQQHKLSVQEAARQLRYEWFEKIRCEHKFDFIATAHHLSDNIETVLFNLARGTGIRGLRGMLPRQGKIVRPLLFAQHYEIEQFAQSENLQWREDSSNSSDKYSRNFLRHHIIPLFKQLNPSFEQTFANNIAVFAELEEVFNYHYRKLAKSLFFQRHNDIYISIEKLKQIPERRSVLFTFLRDYGFLPQQVDNILENLHGQPGAVYLAEDARVIRDRRFLILTPGKEASATVHYIHEINTHLSTDNFSLIVESVESANISLKTTPETILVNKKLLEFPLVLRRWKAGDYFYPFGFNRKKKKVKKFLTDEKLPLHEKEKVWVLESNKKIVWVVGLRADERFRVQPTDEIVKISIIRHENTVD